MLIRHPWARLAPVAAPLLVALSVGACGSASDDFDLRLRLVSPAHPDPFAGASLVEVDLFYADGTDWHLYWEGAQGTAEFPGVPRGAVEALGVRALWYDPAYDGNATPLATGSIQDLVLDGSVDAAVLVARRGVVSTLAESLAVPRESANVAAFSDGTVVIVGGGAGAPGQAAVTSVEVGSLYGDTPLAFSAVADLPRVEAPATVVGDQVVVWGGLVVSPADLLSAEPAEMVNGVAVLLAADGAVTLTVLEPEGLTPRYAAATASLGDGRVAALGGLTPGKGSAVGVTPIDLFDPAAGTGVPAGHELARARIRHTASPLGGGVLAAGGWDLETVVDGAPSAVLGSLELFVPDQGVLDLGSLNTPRAAHAAVSLSQGRWLVVGGMDAAGAAVSDAELYSYDPSDPQSGVQLLGVWPLLWPRWGAAVVALPDGTAVVCGGASPEGPVEPCERFTDSGPAPGFSAVVDASGDGDATLSGLTDGAEGAAGTLLPNGMAIFVGGRAGDPSAAVRVFNP